MAVNKKKTVDALLHTMFFSCTMHFTITKLKGLWYWQKNTKKRLGHLRLKCIQIYPSFTNTDLSVHAKCSIWCLHTFFQSLISIPNIQNQPNTSRGLWLGGPNMNWGYPNHTLILWLNWKLCDLNMQLIPEGIVQLKHACIGSKLAQSHSECVSGIPSNNMQ